MSMGIFTSSRNSRITTRDFYFGVPEAEGENKRGSSLVDYFEDYLDIIKDLGNGRFIFTGRKGVGKSAIAKYIKDKSDESNESYAILLKDFDFNTERIRLINRKNEEEDIIPQLFEWMILVNTIALILESQGGTYTDEYRTLEKFYKSNFGSIEARQFRVIEKTIEKKGFINCKVLYQSFGSELGRHLKTVSDRAPFYELILPLQIVVKKILSFPIHQDNEFWILFDDLDIGHDIRIEAHNNRIMQLLRVAKKFNTEVFNKQNAKVLIFLRDDMANMLKPKYSDSAKVFNSYVIPINWYDQRLSVTNENSIPLKRLVNKRIEVNFRNLKIPCYGSAWENLVENLHNGKTSFKAVLDYTFYRPRDFITFLQIISKNKYDYPISEENLKQIMKQYVAEIEDELRSELCLFFSREEINRLFDTLFPFIANCGTNTYADVKGKIDKLSFSMPSKEVLDILLSYSLLVPKDSSGALYYNYREQSLFDINSSVIRLHKSVYHKYKPIYAI